MCNNASEPAEGRVNTSDLMFIVQFIFTRKSFNNINIDMLLSKNTIDDIPKWLFKGKCSYENEPWCWFVCLCSKYVVCGLITMYKESFGYI